MTKSIDNRSDQIIDHRSLDQISVMSMTIDQRMSIGCIGHEWHINQSTLAEYHFLK